MEIFCAVTWCGNFSYPQNFQTKELGEIELFYAVILDYVKYPFQSTVTVFNEFFFNLYQKIPSKFADNNTVSVKYENIDNLFHIFNHQAGIFIFKVNSYSMVWSMLKFNNNDTRTMICSK